MSTTASRRLSLDPGYGDEHGIMPMDSIDEMDMILMQPSDKDGDELRSPKLSKSFSFSPQEDEPHVRSGEESFEVQLIEQKNMVATLSLVTRIHHFRQMSTSGFHG
jgi:hypothetical protein